MRLQRYLERQRELFESLSSILDRQFDAIRRGDSELLAVQAAAERAAVDELAVLQRSIQTLREAGAGSPAPACEEAVRRAREQVLRGNRRNRELLGSSLDELRRLIRELQGRPRTPASPFADIGRPTWVDLLS